MSTPPRKAGAAPGTVVVAAVAGVFCFVVAAVVVITIAIPDGGNAGSLVALLLGSFAALVPSLLALSKIADVGETVDRNSAQLTDLSNGVGDAKFKAAVHAAMDERADQSTTRRGPTE